MIADRPLISFSVLGVPVEVGASALLLLGFLALSFGRSGTAGLVAGIAYAVVLLASVLVHELGHAVVGSRLGLRPRRIMLHGFGGFTEYGRRPRPAEGVISSMAGPLAGLALGVVCLLLRLTLGPALPPLVAGMLQAGVFINFFWSLFNLLPIFPMDGGQALRHALLLRLPPARVERIVRNVTVPTAIIVGIAGYAAGFVFIPLICFFAVMQVIRL